MGTHGGKIFDRLYREQYPDHQLTTFSFCGASSYSFLRHADGNHKRMTCGIAEYRAHTDGDPTYLSLIADKIHQNRTLSANPYIIEHYSQQLKQYPHTPTTCMRYTDAKEGQTPELEHLLLGTYIPNLLIIALGTNEFVDTPHLLKTRYQKLVNLIPGKTQCIILGMPSMRTAQQSRQDTYDENIANTYAAYYFQNRCEVIDTRFLNLDVQAAQYHTADGIHLKKSFYHRWGTESFKKFLELFETEN